MRSAIPRAGPSTIGATAAAIVVVCIIACDRRPAGSAAPAPPASSGQAAPAGSGQESPASSQKVELVPSAAESIDRMKRRYANAASYRDRGVCTLTVTSRGVRGAPELMVDFSTVFDRTRGLVWRADQRSGTDPQVNEVIVRTRDFAQFDWSSTLLQSGGRGVGAWAAFKETLGNTGFMAGVIPAWLLPTMDVRHVRLDLASITGVRDAGSESIDGVRCTMIDAEGWMGQELRMWVDGTGALRRLRAVRRLAQAFDVPASVNETVIDFHPEFDVPIEEGLLDPPPEDRSER